MLSEDDSQKESKEGSEGLSTSCDITTVGNNESSKEEPKVKFDWIVSHRLGQFGKYQKKVYILLGLPAIICAFHSLAYVFLAADINYRCQLKDEDPSNFSYYTLPFGRTFNESFPPDTRSKNGWSQCLKYEETEIEDVENVTRKIVDCNGKYVYDSSQYSTTARFDFKLICGNTYWYTVAETLFKGGILVGALLFGNLSDRCGRRPVFFYALCQQAVFGLVAAIAPNYTIFVIARFLVGAANSGVFLVAFVIGMELVGKDKRMIAAMGLQYFFTFGWVLEGIIAYFIRDWRYLQLVISLPSLLFLSYYWLMPESTRWLLTHGRKHLAIQNLKKAANTNGVTIPDSELNRLCEEKKPKSGDSVGISELLQYRRTILRSLNVFFCWFINSGVYYGLALNAGNLGGNDYVNFILSGAVEVPAYALLLLTLNRYGRKKVLCVCMILTGGFLISCGFLPSEHTWLLVTFNMLGKLFNAAAYAAIYMFAAELFPTVIRNSFMGISSVSARVGGILSDYVILVRIYWKPLPHLIFGCVSLAAGLLSLLLPETLGKRLPETMEDGEKFGTSAYDNANTIYREEENNAESQKHREKESPM